MVSVTVKISGDSVVSVLEGVLSVQGKYPDLRVEPIAESQQRLLATNVEPTLRRRRAVGLSRNQPGQRMMDYVLKAMQKQPNKTWTINDLTSAVGDAGCQTSKVKLSNGLHPCLSAMKLKIGLVDKVGSNTYVLTPRGKSCSFPIPFTMSGSPLV